MAYNRYSLLTRPDGTLSNLPKIILKVRDTDKYVIYDSQKTRLDRISFDVYGDDTFNWLILLANPQYFIEFDIANGSVIRVPYPLNDVLSEYESQINSQKGK